MSMKKTILIFSFLLILLVSGCGGGQEISAVDQQATVDFSHAVETSIVETIAAVIPEDEETPAPGQTEVPPVDPLPTLTNTVVPLATLAPTQPSSAFTPTPTPLSTPCYLAVLVEETIPDGTVITIGDGFTKVWVVRNAGVCSWSEDFRWQLVSGHDFRGITDVKISNKDVQPGESITISIEMGSPLIPGDYRSVYKIFTPEGAEITPNGFWIDVIVVEK